MFMIFSDSVMEVVREGKKTITINGRSLAAVAKNLCFLYHACVASEGLLLDGATQIPSSGFDDRLQQYYLEHLEEETGEIAVLKSDLAGAKIETGFPDNFSMAMVGTQYYLIRHVHPVALLGYLAVQEADPTPLGMVEELERLHGKDLFRFLRMHALKDQEHRKEILELLDQTPQKLQGLITLSALNSLGHYRQAAASWR